MNPELSDPRSQVREIRIGLGCPRECHPLVALASQNALRLSLTFFELFFEGTARKFVLRHQVGKKLLSAFGGISSAQLFELFTPGRYDMGPDVGAARFETMGRRLNGIRIAGLDGPLQIAQLLNGIP